MGHLYHGYVSHNQRVMSINLLYFTVLKPSLSEPQRENSSVFFTEKSSREISEKSPISDSGPKDVKEENVGVAFDASSRLRRAGVEYFHDRRFSGDRSTRGLWLKLQKC